MIAAKLGEEHKNESTNATHHRQELIVNLFSLPCLIHAFLGVFTTVAKQIAMCGEP